MRDDWRLSIEFPSSEQAKAFADAARARLPEDCETSQADECVYVYPDTEEGCSHARQILEDLALEEFRREIVTRRWNPGRGRWQDPTWPIEPETASPPIVPDPDECSLEIVLRVPYAVRAVNLRDEAAGLGFLAVASGRDLRIAARDESEADRITKWLAKNSRTTAEPTVRPLGWFRHWQWRQWIRGNYAGGGNDPTQPR